MPTRAEWVQIYKEAKGDVFRATDIAGVPRSTALLWRRRLFGGHWTKRSSVRDLNPDNIEELRAALEARISPTIMGHRFGVGPSTLRKIIRIYGLPRIRKPRTPKQPSKAW